MGFKDAAKLRDLISKIAGKEVSRLAPPARLAEVVHIDRENNLAEVRFVGDTGTVRIAISPGLQPQFSEMDTTDELVDIVRVGGRPGSYYIISVESSPHINLLYEDTRTEVDGIVTNGPTIPAPLLNPSGIMSMPGPGAIVLDWTNTYPQVYDVFMSKSNLAAPTEADRHPEFQGVPAPIWIRTMPDGSDLTYSTPAPTEDDPNPIKVGDTYYVAVQARTNGGTGPALTAADWKLAQPGLIDPDHLVLTVGMLLANNLFVEAAKLVNLSVTGDFTANTMTATGKVALRAANNEMGPGSKLILQAGTTAPASPPTWAQDYEEVTTPPLSSSVAGATWYNGKAYFVLSSTIMEYDPALNTFVQVGPTFSGASLKDICRVGSEWAVLRWGNLDGQTGGYYTWYVEYWDSAWTTMARRHKPWGNAPGGLQGDNPLASVRIAYNGTNLCWIGYPTDGTFPIRPTIGKKLTTTGATTGTDVANAGTTTFSTGGQYTIDTLNVGNFDYGAERFVFEVTSADKNTGIYVYTNAGVEQSSNNWPRAHDGTPGDKYLMHDGTIFRHFSRSQSKFFKYTRNMWTDTSSKFWASGAWGNAAGELTDQGPRVSFSPKKRSRIQLIFPPIPAGSNKVVPYLARTTSGAADPGRTAMWSVGSSASSTLYIADPPVYGAPSTNPLAAPNYTDSSPASIESSKQIGGGPGTQFKADASGQFGHLRVDANGRLMDRAKMYLTADQTLTTATWTLAASCTAAFDGDSMVSNVASQGRITIKRSGLYLVTGRSRFNTNATGWRGMAIRRNLAAGGAVDVAVDYTNGFASQNATLQADVLVELEAGDYLTFQMHQTSGANLILQGVSEHYTTLSAVRVA